MEKYFHFIYSINRADLSLILFLFRCLKAFISSSVLGFCVNDLIMIQIFIYVPIQFSNLYFTVNFFPFIQVDKFIPNILLLSFFNCSDAPVNYCTWYFLFLLFCPAKYTSIVKSWKGAAFWLRLTHISVSFIAFVSILYISFLYFVQF